ncbi:unnamed protein product [Paramecium pentaurelia]|uniref:WD40-repeat-containing domain n=1 Tax=Paramecium pentaurelia TaxID=43138 RepID=A0A8S1X434_9CILI|nr:unnamed protein product [Paramecium pentaurelia]
MNPKNYQICNIKGHDDEYLNMICIGEKCNKHQLLCCYCIQDHNKCQTIPISKFVQQFKQQLQSQINDQEQNFESLEVFYNKIQSNIEKAQKKIIETFQKQIDAIKNAKSTIQQLLKQQKTIKDQKQKLQEFESNMTQVNCSSLLAEIIDFKPNSDRFSFSLKKIQGQQINQIQDRILNGSKYSQQYQDFMKRFVEQFEKQNQQMEVNLLNFFLNAPQDIQDLEQNNNNLQSNMQSEIQINQIQVQDRQQNTIGINRNNTNINNIENNQSPKRKFNQLENDNFSPINKQIQNSQMSSTQISNTNFTKQQSFSDSKQTNNQQSIEINQQSTPQFQQQLQQPIQQNTSQQFSSIGNLPKSHQEQLNPPSPNLQLLNAELQNDNQIESEKLIDISQGRSFQIESNGKKFTKILFLNNSMLAGCCESQFLIFDLITCQQKFKRTVGAYITDAVYINSNDLNGTLFLAMNNGKVLAFNREQKMNQPFIFNDYKEQVVDKSGNLLIQINKKDNQLVSFGEDKIIKIWQLNDFKEVKRCELNEVGTALHLDSEYIYVGGLQYLYIWNQVNQFKKILKIQQTKIIYINTHLNKLVVGSQDKIKVFERTSNGDYQHKNEQIFESISSMNILKKWPILIVSNTYQQQQQVCLYNYELCSLAKLKEQIATCCTVGEFDNLNLLGFVYENGQFVVYRIQQSQQQL